ncbi:MAG: hypothetical protein JSW00_03990 [Thermoplasmata archaeon]|nr:MAG: hypothetical protein JSW00_03990 [Thermoplasmata archaeon]
MMSENINVTLPDNIVKYLHMKSKAEYLPMSAVARKYIAKGVVEEMVIEYYKQGFSIKKLAEMTDTSIAQIMQILRGLNEELEDIDQELSEIEEMS